MCSDYCSKRAFSLEHFLQCKSIREEVEHSVRFYTTWPFLVPSKTHRQHHPHSSRSMTENRLLLWMSNFIRYTQHDHGFSFHLSKMSDRGHTLFFTPPTRVCVQLYGTADQTFSYFFFEFAAVANLKKKNATGGCVKTSLFNIMEMLY